MMKKLLSLLLLACLALSALAGCNPASGKDSASASDSTPATESSSDSQIEEIDYAGNLKLNMNSDSLKLEVTMKQHIDGDTTHFHADLPFLDNGILKARYIAINTPESTGTIEPWGKKASNYTKNALSTATSIIVESDTSEWKPDSTGTRYMTWVWYKAPGSNEYRNLNLELLQEAS